MPIPPIPQGIGRLNAFQCQKGFVLTLPEMTQAFLSGTVQEKREFIAPITEFIFSDLEMLPIILGQITDEDRCAMLINLFLAGSPKGVCCNVALDPSLDHTFCSIAEGMLADCCILIDITLGKDVLSGGFSGTNYALGLPNCENKAQFIDIPDVVTTDLITGKNAHLGDAFQVILNLISALANGVQNICDNAYSWTNLLVGATGQVYLGTFPGVVGALRIRITENPNPALINWSPPEPAPTGGVQRFGKFVWLKDDMTESEVLFHNTNFQVFVPPGPEWKAFRYYANYGVVPQFQWVPLYGWPGDVFPTLNDKYPPL